MNKHALFIGRFQPPHVAHVQTARTALQHAERLTIALGSANLARSAKNPFSAAERAEMWRAALPEISLERLRFVPLPDRLNAELWAADVRSIFPAGEKVLLVGHQKDASSEYLTWFPDFSHLFLPLLEGGLSSTDLRRLYFSGKLHEAADHLPLGALRFLQHFAETPHFDRLAAEAAAPAAAASPRQSWCWAADGQIWLRVRPEVIGRGLLELPSLPLTENGVGLQIDDGGRGTGRPPLWLTKGPPPRELWAELLAFPDDLAFRHPERFFGDDAAALARLAEAEGLY